MKRLFLLPLLIAPLLQARAQWTLVNNNGYQAVTGITSGGGALYMAATSTSSFASTVFKSTDGGTSWSISGNGLPSGQPVHSVHYANGVLLCGTEGGMYRSTDGGSSWALSNSGLPGASSSNYPAKLYQFGTTTVAIYSATIGNGGGVFRTTDGGVQWHGGNNGLATNMTVHQVCQAGSLLYAATTAGLAYSNNMSVTWTQMPTGNFACFGVQGTASRLMVISGLGYRYSNNGGTTWTNATGGPAVPMGGELILYDGKYWAINTASPMDVLRSTDNGASFSVYENGLIGADAISQNTFHASGDNLYLGCFGNLYVHAGSTVGVEEQGAAAAVPHPSPFTDGFFVDCPAEGGGSMLAILDATGREAGRRPLVPGTNWIARDGLPAGAYRLVMEDRGTGAILPLGTVVAQ